MKEASGNETKDAEKIIVMCQQDTIGRAWRLQNLGSWEKKKMHSKDDDRLTRIGAYVSNYQAHCLQQRA